MYQILSALIVQNARYGDFNRRNKKGASKLLVHASSLGLPVTSCTASIRQRTALEQRLHTIRSLETPFFIHPMQITISRVWNY